MNDIDVTKVDLNLLSALHALLEEGSVTRAAQRSGVTQSSMSHALARLRTWLRDPLFVRAGRQMQPTPRAQALRDPVAAVLAQVQRMASDELRFDPATSQRNFVIACSDLLAAVLPGLLADIAREAPHVRLEHRLVHRDFAPLLLEGGVDVALAVPIAEAPGLKQRALGRVHWAVFGRRRHPAFAGRWSKRAWLAYPHVVIGTGGVSLGILGEALKEAGLTRRVGLVLSAFVLAPFAVASTDFLLAAPLELAAPVAAVLGLEHRSLPLALPPTGVNLYWAERVHADAGHRWLREKVVHATKQLLAAS